MLIRFELVDDLTPDGRKVAAYVAPHGTTYFKDFALMVEGRVRPKFPFRSSKNLPHFIKAHYRGGRFDQASFPVEIKEVG